MSEDSPRNVAGPLVASAEAATVDAVLDVLVNARRRAVLAAVLERSGWTDLDHLAELFTESGTREAGELDDEYLRSELYHVHLPKLEKAGIVDFDRNRVAVRPAGDEQRLEMCREILSESAT